MSSNSCIQVDKKALARAFGRAAKQYDHFAAFQRTVGEQLMAHCDWHTPGLLVDAGAGSGWFSRYFREQGHCVTAFDLSRGMLQQAAQQHSADHYVCGDLEAFPFHSQSVDYLWSNLALQWCSDFQQTLQQLQRSLTAEGKLAVSTLAAGSLPEIEQVWQQMGRSAPINRWSSAESLLNATESLGLRAWQAPIVCHFSSPLDALWSLKGIGASHLHAGRQSGLGGREFFTQLAEHWPRDDKGYRLTYHIVFGVTR
ncbi:malonyl-ACP O-methyltransferase BioC [Tatumella ptyseos]|uniref:malonyl-ACP O-methyltransferase BioC n=1 Tax=Tatumella ptyseos TaxID=82987 RepID=UPI0026EBE9C0|nr:malonyl-ACP O-methyltransferase BioC [Tatumella ptyseos]WKX27519.1 malonyl-ACP O-methyltransferase BioC [Tatumella ptyseos]